MTITYSYAGGVLCKPCSRCGVVKPLSDYYIYCSGRNAGRYYARCKACGAELAKLYEATHPEQRRARARKWREENRERYSAWCKAWRARRRALGLPYT